jgi:L-asparaginase II
MAQYPALTSGTGRPELEIATALGAVVKGGAEGCIGIALRGRLGVAAKADDGSFSAAVVGVVAALAELGLVTEHPALAAAARIPVLGGGRRVGWITAGLPR